ncbi:hypothetical protein [Psychrobacter sp. Rd 27.2]|uniref:hypothetical protein n=1 Tax=Psychrobacter sp. Rd 27.2 TaxID=1926479 RepID=UPI000946C5A2|nr:hypothetical protein [Psychrobacter sp. Rd 27.2]OLF40808.1 hypothetical protein BTV99_07230 [Psychrobacter sp. Rd 27.2]
MTDKELIMKLGGVVVVAEYLGVTYQCVFNWLSRGIPPKVKLDYPEVFLSKDPQPLAVRET